MKNIFLFAVSCFVLSGCSSTKKTTNAGKDVEVINEKTSVLSYPVSLSPGIPAYTATTVNYKRNNKNVLTIQFNDFITIGVAQKPEKWGHFQFPHIARKPDGSLQAQWSMNDDAMEAYGIERLGSANSVDGGKTWRMQEKYQTTGGLLLPNGDHIQIATPRPIKTANLKLPNPIGFGEETYRKSKYSFYKLGDLPDSCRGVYFKRLKKGETEWKTEHDSLYDSVLVRHSLAGLLPVVWWGDMHMAADGSVIAGIYPGTLVKPDGTINNKSGIFFYRSTDNGYSWRVQGRIPYQPNLEADPNGNKRMGYTEPAFEILKDGTLLCIMRTTDGIGTGPMYASYSKDMGKTWTIPAIMAANGVLPRLLQLGNGVVVLSAGRPGVQLRFSADGKDKWTDPFEMLPYKDEKDQVSCGYTGLLSTGKDSFLMIMSDFRYKTPEGDRKAIKIREIIVKPG